MERGENDPGHFTTSFFLECFQGIPQVQRRSTMQGQDFRKDIAHEGEVSSWEKLDDSFASWLQIYLSNACP